MSSKAKFTSNDAFGTITNNSSRARNWINIVPAWPPEFMYRDMAEVGLELSKKLRGEDYGCDIILALTHAR